MSDKKERILLTQIKQDFTTPVDAISDYINLIIDSSDIYDEEISDEFENIKKSAKTLRLNFIDAFKEYAEQKNKSIKNDEEASVLRHDLRTPLNGIIGYSEILIEDYEDDISDNHKEDLGNIINLAKEVESAISNFVDFLKGGSKVDLSKQDNEGSAESLFSSLGKIEAEIKINDEIKKSKILIVDDIKTNCDVLQRRLESSGFKTEVAMSGKEALAAVDKKNYDLVLLDVLMPEINGLEVLIKAREKFDLDKLPIIMVSSFDDVESISKCLQLGANEYLPKPLNSTILLAKVAATLERKMLREREKELLSELHHQAITDEMTGIPGDEIIKKVCDLAKDNIESPSIFGRIGGEEFLAIIYNSSMNYLHDLCEKIRQVVEKETTLFDNQKIKVTISGGGAFTSESLNISDLVNKADERLYLSKKNGRNKFYLKED